MVTLLVVSWSPFQGVKLMTGKMTGVDSPPPGAGLITVIEAVTGAMRSVAGMLAVRVVAFT